MVSLDVVSQATLYHLILVGGLEHDFLFHMLGISWSQLTNNHQFSEKSPGGVQTQGKHRHGLAAVLLREPGQPSGLGPPSAQGQQGWLRSPGADYVELIQLEDETQDGHVWTSVDMAQWNSPIWPEPKFLLFLIKPVDEHLRESYFWIWRLSEIGVPPNHPFEWAFSLSTIHLGVLPFMEPPHMLGIIMAYHNPQTGKS